MIDLLTIEDLVFSKVVKEFPKDEFGLTEINFTNKDSSTSDKLIFPSIYIHGLNGSENAQTLENDELNGRQIAIEVMVRDNNDDEIVKSISNKIVSIFKSMMFNVVTFPLYSTVLEVNTASIRFRRSFDADDNFKY